MSEDERTKSGEPRERGRAGPWLLVAFAVAVAVGLALFLWPGGGDAPERPESAERPPPAPRPASFTPAPAPPGGASPPSPPAPPEDPIAAYRERTRYAPGSGRLSREAVDLLEPNRRYERPRPVEATLDRGPDGVVEFHLEADRYYYTSDETVAARLLVERGGERLPVAILAAEALPTGTAEEDQDEQKERLTFGLDADGAPKTELALAESFPEHHGTIDLRVEFQYEPGGTEEASLRIFSTPADRIPAAFTGRYADHADTGNLVVEVGVDVGEPGFYRIDANLFGPDGEPLAFAAFKGDLAAGEQSARVEFFGLLLRDVAVPGPYEVRDVRGYLFREAAYPDKLRLRDSATTHWTRAYEIESFSDEEYTSPHKEQMLELLEADEQSGVGVDTPDSPDAAETPN